MIDLTHIQMVDARMGWGIGSQAGSGFSGHVFRTADGGLTWVDVTPPETSLPDPSQGRAVGFFQDSSTAWVTFHGIQPTQVPQAPFVWRTNDGGSTWQAGNPLDTGGLNEVYSVSDLYFTGAGGWLLAHVGAGMNHDYVVLYRSQDGGANWTRPIDPNTNDGGIQSCSKTGILFTTAIDGWLTGNCNGVMPGAFLFHTSDGGQTWQPVSLPDPAGRPGLFADFENACGTRRPFHFGIQVYIVVECSLPDGTAAAYLYASADSGAGWNIFVYPGGDFQTIDGDTGWALGKTLYRTTDGGRNWQAISQVTWEGQFTFISPQLGWAVALKDSTYGLVDTLDGGTTWSLLTPVVVAP